MRPAVGWYQVPSRSPMANTGTFTDPDGHLWEAIVSAI